MIYTSYFARYKGNNGVSIAKWTPKWFNNWICSILAPSADLLKWWKSLTEDERKDLKYQKIYTDRFTRETLDPIERAGVINRLAADLQDKVLLCYETSKDFCHRHIVADWLTSHGYECKELEY